MSESYLPGATLSQRTAGVINRRTLIAGGSVLAAAAPAAAAAASPDAELIRLCAEMVALDRRLCGITREMADKVDGPEEERLYQAARPLVAPLRALVDQIARIPARTPGGFQAKAEAARHDMAGDADEENKPMDPDDALVWSLVEDLLRRA